MNSYEMYQRCKDHQPDNRESGCDSDMWRLLVAEGCVSREATPVMESTCKFVEDGGRYPGFHPLDDVEAGRAIFV